MKYHLKFWGGDYEELLSKVNLKGKDHFFSSNIDRQNFKNNLITVMQKYNLNNVVFDENDGDDVNKERVCIFSLRTPDGVIHDVEESFGYGYPVDSIYFMLEEGNYSCDCNKSLFLQNSGVDIEEYPCGDEIKLVDIMVELR